MGAANLVNNPTKLFLSIIYNFNFLVSRFALFFRIYYLFLFFWLFEPISVDVFSLCCFVLSRFNHTPTKPSIDSWWSGNLCSRKREIIYLFFSSFRFAKMKLKNLFFCCDHELIELEIMKIRDSFQMNIFLFFICSCTQCIWVSTFLSRFQKSNWKKTLLYDSDTTHANTTTSNMIERNY